MLKSRNFTNYDISLNQLRTIHFFFIKYQSQSEHTLASSYVVKSPDLNLNQTRTVHGYNCPKKATVTHTVQLQKNQKKIYFTHNKENNIHNIACVFVSTTFGE